MHYKGLEWREMVSMKIHYNGFIREKVRRNPIFIRPDASFFEARDYVHVKGIRHLPVVDKDDRLVGIVTDRDIRKAAPSDTAMLRTEELGYLLTNLKVSSFMTPREKLITITSETPIEEAVQLMQENKIGCLPILKGDRLNGIFTETDALDFLADVYGFKKKGTRLTIALADEPGRMLEVFEIFKRHDANVVSVASPSFKVEGKRVAAIRIRTEKYEPIVKDLEKAGYEVLSIGKWSPT